MEPDTTIPLIAGKGDGASVALAGDGTGAAGGTAVRLRPLGRGERAAVLEVFAHLSPRSRALRFLAPVRRLDGPLLELLTDVDQDRHVAWVAEAGSRGVGVGRYARLPGDPASAEVAVEVADDHQGRGIGRVLMEVLLVVAAASGVGTLVVHAHYTNTPVLRLAAGIGATGSYHGGMVELCAPVAVPGSLHLDQDSVLTLAGLARGATTAA